MMTDAGRVMPLAAVLSYLRTQREFIMAWTYIMRRKYRRDGRRYGSDITDGEWAVIEPHMLRRAACGRPRETSLRQIVSAIFSITQTGCQCRMLPSDFPPFTTVQRHFDAWRDESRWQTIYHALLMDQRKAEGREASPSAGVVDGQSAQPRKRAARAGITRHAGLGGGLSISGSSPRLYGIWLEHACRMALEAPNHDERIVFINAWNEWAEGAHLEPDLHYGYTYLRETARVVEQLVRPRDSGLLAAMPSGPFTGHAGRRPRGTIARIINKARRKAADAAEYLANTLRPY